MADIGKIHHVFNLVAVVFQNPSQDIFKNIGSEIADMSEPIDGRTAGIKTDPFVFQGLKSFLFASEGVK